MQFKWLLRNRLSPITKKFPPKQCVTKWKLKTLYFNSSLNWNTEDLSQLKANVPMHDKKVWKLYFVIKVQFLPYIFRDPFSSRRNFLDLQRPSNYPSLEDFQLCLSLWWLNARLGFFFFFNRRKLLVKICGLTEQYPPLLKPFHGHSEVLFLLYES